MARCVIWIEGVDFGETLFDTEKLSVIRGASRALEEMPYVADEFFNHAGLNPRKIAAGASIAGFIVEADYSMADAKCDELMTEILEKRGRNPDDVKPIAYDKTSKLNTSEHAPFAHLRFHSAIVDVDGTGPEACIARARACVRLKQLKEPGVAELGWGDGAAKFDSESAGGFRDPRAHDFYHPGEDNPRLSFSNSSGARWFFGRAQRHRIYDEVRRKHGDVWFTDSIQAMIDNEPDLPKSKKLPVALRNKIAVFAADGDKFTKELIPGLSKRCEGYDKGLAVLTHALTGRMNGLLEALVSGLKKMQPEAAIVKQEEEDGKDRPRFRFETILFGGDDVTFIVPAWLGWWLAKTFFDETKKWQITSTDARTALGDRAPKEFAPIDMKFSAGLVFANAKTPIRTLRELAQELCHSAKAVGGLDVEILESIEPPHGGIGPHRKRLTGTADGSPIARERLNAHIALLDEIWVEKRLPASQAHRTLAAAKKAGDGKIDGAAAANAAVAMLRKYAERAGKEFEPLLQKAGLLPESPLGCEALHLYRLLQQRDYIRAHNRGWGA